MPPNLNPTLQITEINKKKSVLLLFSESAIGGAEVSLTRMAKSCRDTNYHVGTIGNEGPWSAFAEKLGFYPLIFGNGRYRLIGSAHRALKYAQRHNVDVIYMCGFRLSVAMRLLTLFKKSPKLVAGIRWNPSSSSWLDRVLRVLERFITFKLAHYITNSQMAKITLQNEAGLSEAKISNVYNGIDIAEFLNIKPYHYSSEKLTVLVPANLSFRKGHIPFLERIEQIVAKRTDVEFYFMGRDQQNGKVQQEIKKRNLSSFVHCIGYKSDAISYIAGADVVVLPSQYGEGCPTSLLEAQALKVPVVAYNIDGIPEIVRHKVDGLLYDKEDPQIVSGILSLLNCAVLRQKMGISGHQKIREKFSLDLMAKQHHDIWLSIK